VTPPVPSTRVGDPQRSLSTRSRLAADVPRTTGVTVGRWRTMCAVEHVEVLEPPWDTARSASHPSQDACRNIAAEVDVGDHPLVACRVDQPQGICPSGRPAHVAADARRVLACRGRCPPELVRPTVRRTLTTFISSRGHGTGVQFAKTLHSRVRVAEDAGQLLVRCRCVSSPPAGDIEDTQAEVGVSGVGPAIVTCGSARASGVMPP